MLRIGTQSKNVVSIENPEEGFRMLKEAGFSCCDFSLNEFLLNTDLYKGKVNHFFAQLDEELFEFFKPYKDGAANAGITINQMHMPYPIFVPKAKDKINDFLMNEVAPKSMKICGYFDCPNIVIHGYKAADILGSEEKEWECTERFIDSIAPLAIENHTVICIENLYTGIGSHIVEGPCCNAELTAERIDRVNERYGAEVLGFCFDTGHANIVGIDMEDFITTLGTRLRVLHIHDNDGRQDLHQIPFTFTRTRENKASTDWDGFIRGLAKIGFDGVLSFETAPVLTSFPPEMKRDALVFIAKIGEYFAKQIENRPKLFIG